MIRFIIPIILIGVAITSFFMLTSPLYQDISLLRAQVASYNEALDNSKALENERDKLTSKYNAISLEDLDRLQKFLPDNIDNIRLILEIEKIASPYGMVLKNVKYDTNDQTTSGGAETIPGAVQGAGSAVPAKSYGVWNLEFSTTGTYENFISFTKDLESNLRIVDISSVTFSSETDLKTNPLQAYTYDFKIKTYWLKN